MGIISILLVLEMIHNVSLTYSLVNIVCTCYQC